MPRVAPPEFVAEMVRRFGAGHDAVWNDQLHRWQILSPSAAGNPVPQTWGWFRRWDATLAVWVPVPAGPDGLPPFRDLDAEAQAEILGNMERSFVFNRAEGHATWGQRLRATSSENAEKKQRARRHRAQLFADLLSEVRIARPWVKDHKHEPEKTRVTFAPPPTP